MWLIEVATNALFEKLAPRWLFVGWLIMASLVVGLLAVTGNL